MALSLSLKNQKKKFGEARLSVDIRELYELQARLIITQYKINSVRIVYQEPLVKTCQEIIFYSTTQAAFSSRALSELRSEKWLIDFPHCFSLKEVSLDSVESICYFCPFSYLNQKPEYIQIFSSEYLDKKTQDYVQQTAILLSKYLDICLESIRQQNEIQLLEQVVQRASHQLRNSLALIGLYAENLSLGLQDNSYQEQAKVIQESIQELDDKLLEMLYCSQGAKLKVSLHDLRSLVQESLRGLSPLINQKQITINLTEASTNLAIDRLQMKQVFDNLLSNAIHFSPFQGTVTCNWQIFQNEVIIKISDQGMGFCESDLQKIFTPFYSRRPGGTGLGLTIAKKIVLDHQGSISATNLLNSGAQFSIILPR